jgi:hypothetical protein
MPYPSGHRAAVKRDIIDSARKLFNISKYVGAVKVFGLLNFMSSSTLLLSAQMHCIPSTG